MSRHTTLSREKYDPKMQKRVNKRMRMVVPVRVFVQDDSGESASHLAHTLDATEKGARLGGFHGQLELNQTVTVQYQHRRSAFRVVWIGQSGTAQGTQVGLECLDPAKDIWQIEEVETPTALGNAQRPSRIMLSRWGLDFAF